MTETPARIIVGKAGMDKHDRGATIVSRALRDAGFEVIYVGSGHTPEEIASMAVDEDVDGIGLSLLSGAHVELFTQLRAALEELGAGAIPLFAGGTIPDKDIVKLQALGVERTFTPGTPLPTIIDGVREIVAAAPQRTA